MPRATCYNEENTDPLLEADHVRAAQGRSFWFQGLVRQIGIALIQYMVEAETVS
jgi:hypothetical protein